MKREDLAETSVFSFNLFVHRIHQSSKRVQGCYFIFVQQLQLENPIEETNKTCCFKILAGVQN